MNSNLRFAHPGLAIDACNLVNLYASGRLEEILLTIPVPVFITSKVCDEEAKYIWGGPDDDVKSQIELVQLQPYIERSLLQRVELITELEQSAWVYFASYGLRDGEATTGAIAYSRGWAIGTDEHKARSIFARNVPHLQLLTTQELVKFWVDETDPPIGDVQLVLRNIELRGNYTVTSRNILYDWWQHFQTR